MLHVDHYCYARTIWVLTRKFLSLLRLSIVIHMGSVLIKLSFRSRNNWFGCHIGSFFYPATYMMIYGSSLWLIVISVFVMNVKNFIGYIYFFWLYAKPRSSLKMIVSPWPNCLVINIINQKENSPRNYLFFFRKCSYADVRTVFPGSNPYIWPNSIYLIYFSPHCCRFPTWHWGRAFVASGTVLTFLLRRWPLSITTSSSLAALPARARQQQPHRRTDAGHVRAWLDG
jgi:hypothetical protein